MPELPEVETIRRDLETEVVGKRIKPVDVDRHAHRSAATPTRSSSSRRLEGAQDHRRRPAGQVPAAASSTTATLLVIHLRHERASCCGPRARASRRRKHTHVVITFTQGGQLRFVDPRTFGELFVTDARRARPTRSPELAHLGFDPVDEPMSWTDVRRAAARPARPSSRRC